MPERDVLPVGLLETLAAGVAHEVRNPLNSLQINLGVLEQDLRELRVDPQAHAFVVLRRISGEIKRLDDFVSEFLRFARLPPPSLEHHDVSSLLAELTTFLLPEFSKKGVSLVLENLGAQVAQIDRSHVVQAVLNLALNALRATPRGGHVWIRSSVNQSDLRIAVEDDGEGMTDEVRARASTPFFTTRDDGTGLGLAFVRRVVEDHGGSIVIDARPGGGTLVTLAFPRSREG
jgi:signal transduction histidine kinase